MAYALSRLERMYVQMESTYGTIPNIGGTATVAGTDVCRHIRLQMMNQAALLIRPDKTGTRSQTQGVEGRKFAQASVEMGLAASGSLGVVPRADPFLQCLFGKAPTVNPGSNVIYGLDDAIPSMSIYSFRRPASVAQRCMMGTVVTSGTFNLGQDVATWSCNMEGVWVCESDQWANLDATQKGNLTSVAFPVEPTPSYIAGEKLTIGFTGQITMDGNIMANIRTATLTINNGNVTIKDTFGQFYPNDTEGDERQVTLALSLYDNDAVGTSNLRKVAESKAPINVTMQVGSVSGNRWTFQLNNMQLGSETLNDGQRRYTSDYTESRSFATTPTSLDEVALTIT